MTLQYIEPGASCDMRNVTYILQHTQTILIYEISAEQIVRHAIMLSI